MSYIVSKALISFIIFIVINVMDTAPQYQLLHS